MFKSIVLTLLLLCSSLVADEMDMLLSEFAQESDLSVQTKQENSGELLLYTRQDLEKMQVRTLKDVYKHMPLFGYNENRHANPDMLTGTLYANTNQVRFYIDNQEINIDGSVLAFFGNIDIDFVDHIEMYIIAPGYSVSVEANYIVVKLYSKNAGRDAGGTASLRYGSRDTHQETLSYAQKFDNFNYYAYGTRLSENRPKVAGLSGAVLGKDKDATHLFANINTDKDTLQFNYLRAKQDPFASVSPSATTLNAQTKMEYFHVGYEKELTQEISLQLAYDTSEYQLSHTDSLTLLPQLFVFPFFPVYQQFDNTIKDKALSAKLQYKKSLDKHNILTGVKYQHNTFSNNELFAGLPAYTPKAFDKQTKTIAFIEDTYKLTAQSNLTLGAKYTTFNNNGGVANEDFFSYRAGYTQTFSELSHSLFYNHDTMVLPHYMYTSNLYTPTNPNNLKSQNIDAVTYSIQNNNSDFTNKLIFSYTRIKNAPLLNQTTQKIENIQKSLKAYSSHLHSEYKINANHSIKTNLAYGEATSFTSNKNAKYFSGYLHLFNNFGKLNIFNELYFNDTLNDSIDISVEYTLGVSYRYSEALELSLKGENLFYSNNRLDDKIYALDPSTGYTQTRTIRHQTNDKLILAQVKYLF